MRFSLVLVLVVALSEGADVQPSCGRVSGSVGGQDIPPGRWPWFAVLYEKNTFLCPASLVSDQWVLTTIACVTSLSPADLTVVLGRTNETDSKTNEVSRGVTKIECDPLFDPRTLDNDLCLLKLSSPVNFSDYISPVCLASANSTFSNGTVSWIVGYGSLSSGVIGAAELEVQILGNNECQNRTTLIINDNKICTRNYPTTAEPCLATKGGPLLIRNDDMVWIQLGLSKTFFFCKNSLFPPVYTRVSRYQEWISNVTGSSQPGFVTFPSSGDDGVSTATPSPLRPNTTTSMVPPRPNTTPPIIPLKQCKTSPAVPPRTKCDRSIFSSNEKLSSTIFTSISALLFSLVLLVV